MGSRISTSPPLPWDRVFELAAPLLNGSPVTPILQDSWRRDAFVTIGLLYVDDADGLGLVAKVGRGPGAAIVRAEHRDLDRLAAALGPLRSSVPAPLAFEEEGSTAILLQSALPGRTLALPRTPHRVASVARRLTAWLLEVQRRMGVRRERLTGELADALLFAPIARYRERIAPAPSEERSLRELERRLGELAKSELPLVLEHGDLCLHNILVDGERIGVIDWEHSVAHSLPAGDLFHLFATLSRGLRKRRSETLVEIAFGRAGEPRGTFGSLLVEYAEDIGLPLEHLEPLFELFWLRYAVEAREITPTTADPVAWSLLDEADRRWPVGAIRPLPWQDGPRR